jgi:ribosome-binding factor A
MQRSSTKRSLRLGDQIMREVADILTNEIQDPRLNLVTVSGVRMNADMRVAEILFTVGEGEERARNAQAGLDHAKGFVKRQLAGRLQLRQLPELRFCRDTFLEDVVYRGQPGDSPTTP